jgi:large conductance mechanosensitive channel
VLNDFKAFLLRGNVIDLAVAVVVGAAFGQVVNSFVENLLTPLISIPGEVNFAQYEATIGGGVFRYGLFVNSVISFLIVATAVYFLVVRPMTRLLALRRTEPEPAPETKECPECASLVPVAARRCAYCTEVIAR